MDYLEDFARSGQQDRGTSHPAMSPALAGGASSGTFASTGSGEASGVGPQQAGSAPPLATGPFHSLEWMHLLRDAELEPELKALGWALMSFANARGEMRPTLAQLALLTPASEGRTVSESTIKRRRRELVDLGWIRLVEKGKGRGLASVYSLCFPVSKQVTPCEEGGSKNGSSSLALNGSGVTHQERHQVLTPQELEKAVKGEGERSTPKAADLPPTAKFFRNGELLSAEEWFAARATAVGKPTTSALADNQGNSSLAEPSPPAEEPIQW